MRTAHEWPPGKLLLRDTALRLFAERGPDAVSVRDVASAAGVSPGLVVHHFGTRQRLQDAVDDYVTEVLTTLLAALDDLGVDAGGDQPTREQPAGGGPEAGDGSGDGSAAAAGPIAALLEHLPPDSPIPAYVRRMLVAGSAGAPLFGRWFDASLRAAERWAQSGLLRPTDDLPALAAFLLVNDLGVFLLRDHLTAALGVDPLAPEGLARWSAAVMPAYLHGVLAPEALTGPAPHELRPTLGDEGTTDEPTT